MKHSQDIEPVTTDTPEISGEFGGLSFFTNSELAELVWERKYPAFELEDEIVAWEKYYREFVYTVVKDKEARRLKALLREMRLYILKPIGSVKRLRRLLFSHISLLFGLCSSQSSLILNAFYGNSLSRIPSL